jgi:hypothetical protein
MRRLTGIKQHGKGLVVGVALATIAGTTALQATTANAVTPTWPANVWAIGNFNGAAGNFGNTSNPGANPQNNTNNSVATIQAAVNAAEAWGAAHTPTSGPDAGHAPNTFVLLAPGDYKTVASAISPAPPGQIAGGVLITADNLYLEGMGRNSTVIDGTKSGPTCSPNQADQVFGPATDPTGGLNGVLVWKAAGTWVANLTVCNFLDGNGKGAGAGNEIWWNGGANTGKVYTDDQGGYVGDYVTATSTYYPGVNPTTGVSTQLSAAAEGVAATYGIFSSDWNGGIWDNSYASNFNDSGYYIGACQMQCNQAVDHAWSEYNALGYSGSNSGGKLVIENSVFDNNEDGFDTNSQNGDNPPPQNGACPAGVTPPIAGAKTCWVFYRNLVENNNNPNVPTYGSAASGPVGTGMSVSGGRNDTILNNIFEGNNAWGTILAPYPDSGSPCTGGTQLGISCLYDESGVAVIGNRYANNGGFKNPTNGDIGMVNLEPGAPDCFSGNIDASGHLTTSPGSLQVLRPKCTAQLIPPMANAEFLDEVACDSGSISLFGIAGTKFCLPGSTYPRQTKIVMHPLPGANSLTAPSTSTLATMPNPCAGDPALNDGQLPVSPWCP